MLASALAGTLVASVVGSAAFIVGDAVGEVANPVLSEAALGAVALGGFMTILGLAQRLVLSRRVPWAGKWFLANAASGILGGALVLGLFAALNSAVIAVAVGLASIGVIQWFILRSDLPWAAKLAMASVLGLAVAGPLGGGTIAVFFESEIASGSVFGAVYGAVTGLAIIILGKARSA